jgi:hypothetical protein
MAEDGDQTPNQRSQALGPRPVAALQKGLAATTARSVARRRLQRCTTPRATGGTNIPCGV